MATVRVEVRERRPAVIAPSSWKTSIKKSKPKLPNNARTGVVVSEVICIMLHSFW